jgi:hypothetical protein
VNKLKEKHSKQVESAETTISRFLNKIDRPSPDLWLGFSSGWTGKVAAVAGEHLCVFEAWPSSHDLYSVDLARVCSLIGQLSREFVFSGAVVPDDEVIWPLYLTAAGFDPVEFAGAHSWRKQLGLPSSKDPKTLLEPARVLAPSLSCPDEAYALLLAHFGQQHLEIGGGRE